MTRSERLLPLIQILRRHRRPVQGSVLADELGISLRTVYRDIASLQSQGAPIEGEAGLGYVLLPGFTLPPLMFTIEELDALALGAQWVAGRGDTDLANGAVDALAKISAVLPEAMRDAVQDERLLLPPTEVARDSINTRELREAIAKQRKLKIRYNDLKGNLSERVIWPMSIGVFEKVRVLIAWCEQRQDFRHFRTDRISSCDTLDERYKERRFDLIAR